MPHPITIPRLGWSMEEGVLVKWLAKSGELVQAGDMLFELEGEKAAHEIESFESGRLCIPEDAPKPGAKVRVGQVIGCLLAEDETAPASIGDLQAGITASSKQPSLHPMSAQTDQSIRYRPPSVSTSSRPAGPAARRLARQLGIDLDRIDSPDPTGRVQSNDVQRAATIRAAGTRVGGRSIRAIATPRARRRASELGIEWKYLQGTGRDGRVRERDVLSAQRAGLPATSHNRELSPTEPGKHQPATQLRRAIAARVAMGLHLAVPVTLTTKVDAEPLVVMRERLKNDSSILPPSINDLLIHHVAQSLREQPVLNACWFNEGIYTYDAIHIAIAVDTAQGLVAPVLRDVDRLSLSEIAELSQQLISRARAGELSQRELSGGTFSMSNLGPLGVDAFTPILNLPQAAILGVGRIVEEPVVRGGRVEAGKRLTLSLTFDHRVTDGAPAARWLKRLSERIEQSH